MSLNINVYRDRHDTNIFGLIHILSFLNFVHFLLFQNFMGSNNDISLAVFFQVVFQISFHIFKPLFRTEHDENKVKLQLLCVNGTPAALPLPPPRPAGPPPASLRRWPCQQRCCQRWPEPCPSPSAPPPSLAPPLGLSPSLPSTPGWHQQIENNK